MCKTSQLIQNALNAVGLLAFLALSCVAAALRYRTANRTSLAGFCLNILLCLLLVHSTLSKAATCEWQNTMQPPRLMAEDGAIHFKQWYSGAWGECAAKQGGTYELQFIAGDSSEPFYRTKKTIRGGKDGFLNIGEYVARSQFCDEKVLSSGKFKKRVTGFPGDEHVNFVVPVRVKVIATERLSPLSFTTAPVEALCRACDRESADSSVVLRGPPEQKNLRLEASTNASWFRCASQDSTLSILLFLGNSEKAIAEAIQPNMVIENLEGLFQIKGDTASFFKSLPMAKLCSSNAAYLGYELWGKGELKSGVMGGGRGVQNLNCK